MKNGVFFSIIALVLVIFFMGTISPQPTMVFTSGRELKTVSAFNDFIKDFEANYMQNLLRASSVRMLNVMLEQVNETGDNLDANKVYSDLILTGDSDAIDYSDFESKDKNIIADHMLFPALKRLRSDIYDVYKMNLSYQTVGATIQLYEENPWQIVCKLNINYTLTSKVATWDRRNVTILANISTIGLLDPLRLRESGDKAHSRVAISNLLYPSSGRTTDVIDFNRNWTAADLKAMRDNNISNYDEDAPSFLTRLSGGYEQSECCGYELFVNTADDDSHIDHKYYLDDAPEEELFTVKNVAPKLVVDDNELPKYNLCDKNLNMEFVQPLDNVLGPIHFVETCENYVG